MMKDGNPSHPVKSIFFFIVFDVNKANYIQKMEIIYLNKDIAGIIGSLSADGNLVQCTL